MCTKQQILFPVNKNLLWFYSVVVITFGFDPNNPGSNPGRTYYIFFQFTIFSNIVLRMLYLSINMWHIGEYRSLKYLYNIFIFTLMAMYRYAVEMLCFFEM